MEILTLKIIILWFNYNFAAKYHMYHLGKMFWEQIDAINLMTQLQMQMVYNRSYNFSLFYYSIR